MNKIVKSLIGASLVFGLALTASAASFSNVVFENGQTTVSGTGGSTVNATFRVVVPANEVVEWVQTDVVGDSLAPNMTSVGGELGLQEGTHDITLSVKLPPNTGTYTLNVQGAGIYGGVRSISATDNVVGSGSFGSALRVVSTDSDTSTNVGSAAPSWLAALLAQIKALVPATTPASTVSAACTTLASKLVGTADMTYNQANIQLQGYLLSEGMSIPALTAGASFGFKGPQTNAALQLYKTSHGCI